MKKNFLFAVLLVFTFLVTQAQTKAEKRALKLEKKEVAFTAVKTLIESGEFQFEASSAFPLGNDIAKISAAFVGSNNVFQGNTVNLTGNTNFIKITDQTSDLFLPYFGRVYRNVGYNRTGSESGIQFKGDVEEYTVEYDEAKHKVNIKFTANKPQELLKFHLVVANENNVTLTVNSGNRQSIRYQGKINKLPKKVVANN